MRNGGCDACGARVARHYAGFIALDYSDTEHRADCDRFDGRLWHHHRDHSGTQRKRLGWPVVTHNLQRRRAIDDVDQLITGKMAFPMAFPGKLRDAEAAVAVRRQAGGAARAPLQ